MEYVLNIFYYSIFIIENIGWISKCLDYLEKTYHVNNWYIFINPFQYVTSLSSAARPTRESSITVITLYINHQHSTLILLRTPRPSRPLIKRELNFPASWLRSCLARRAIMITTFKKLRRFFHNSSLMDERVERKLATTHEN